MLFIERQKIYAQKVWSEEQVCEKTFWLSSRTPEQFNLMSRTV